MARTPRIPGALAALAALTMLTMSFGAPSRGRAQDQPHGQTVGVELPRDDHASPSVSAELSDGGPALTARFGGYVETSFTWSFGEPSNGLIAYRGFDNRHATINLDNVSLSTRIAYDRVYAHIALQFGRTPDSYYLSEPTDDSGEAFGVGGSSAATYRFIQESYVGWYAPLLNDIAVEAGIFLSPVGIESIDVRSNWNWSRSNLFFALPYYHLGLHFASQLTDEVSVHAAVYNGINNVLDNNPEKSVAAWVGGTFGEIHGQLLYLGGVERDTGNWRSLFDLWMEAPVTPWLDLAFHADGGFEPYGSVGVGWWAASALYARVSLTDYLRVAVRQDIFVERSPNDDPDLRIWWPTTPLVASSTATLTVTPVEYVSVVLEYRHDQTAGATALGGSAPTTPTYFRGTVATDPSNGAWLLNTGTQDTFTIGIVGGF